MKFVVILNGLGFTLVVAGVFLFMSGIHNIDTVANHWKRGNFENIVELSPIGQVLGLDSAYLNGLVFSLVGAVLLLLGGFLFGISLKAVDVLEFEKKK